eukprot:SAG11_NODE_5388_length_1575_cov_0.974255_3_plen_122_part_01
MNLLVSCLIKDRFCRMGNTCMMLIAGTLTIISVVLIKSFVCMIPDGENWANPFVVLYIIVALYAYNLFLTSYLGWSAASTESVDMLIMHRKMLCMWGLVGAILIVAILIGGLEQFVGFHCPV